MLFAECGALSKAIEAHLCPDAIDDAGHQFLISAMTAFSTPLFFSQMPEISVSGSGQVPVPTSTVTAGIPLFTFSQLLNAPSSKDPS